MPIDDSKWWTLSSSPQLNSREISPYLDDSRGSCFAWMHRTSTWYRGNVLSHHLITTCIDRFRKEQQGSGCLSYMRITCMISSAGRLGALKPIEGLKLRSIIPRDKKKRVLFTMNTMVRHFNTNGMNWLCKLDPLCPFLGSPLFLYPFLLSHAPVSSLICR